MPTANKEPKLSQCHAWKGAYLPKQGQILLQLVFHQQNEAKRYGRPLAYHNLLCLGNGKWGESPC